MPEQIHESELIINPDGSIYHLYVRPEELAHTVITVGDPERVTLVSRYFDSVEFKRQHREFVCHTGYLNNKRITVLSTGMGTDNIEIVMNELDALVNIDFHTRQAKEQVTSLNIIRLGTSGSIQPDIDVDSVLVSKFAIGIDGLMEFYNAKNTIQEIVYLEAFIAYLRTFNKGINPYLASADELWIEKFKDSFAEGITITAGGFYAPQGRQLRLKPAIESFSDKLTHFSHKHYRITNFEMETAGIYALGNLFGHRCLSVNAILANRVKGTFSSHPEMVVKKMIETSLELIAENI